MFIHIYILIFFTILHLFKIYFYIQSLSFLRQIYFFLNLLIVNIKLLFQAHYSSIPSARYYTSEYNVIPFLVFKAHLYPNIKTQYEIYISVIYIYFFFFGLTWYKKCCQKSLKRHFQVILKIINNKEANKMSLKM